MARAEATRNKQVTARMNLFHIMHVYHSVAMGMGWIKVIGTGMAMDRDNGHRDTYCGDEKRNSGGGSRWGKLTVPVQLSTLYIAKLLFEINYK